MAQQYPCDGEGYCLACKTHPIEEEMLQCVKCVTLWHVPCLAIDHPQTLVETMNWLCPDCVDMERPFLPFTHQVHNDVDANMVPAMLRSKSDNNNFDDINICLSNTLTRDLQCSICCELFQRPVTTLCGHTYCLKCFRQWIREGKKTCAICRENIPKEICINSALETVIRAAKHDSEKNRGVLVGDTWSHRDMCRQWGAHFPQVADISGHSDHGSHSVVLVSDYVDDDDHGEWFLYTGSDGKDLDGNKHTKHSSDQEFKEYNLALQVSCLKGYPVRVLRSSKDKRSSYAPQSGYRYDGIYRIEKCWQVPGQQGFLVCRYLFVRCDNERAPWIISDVHGDRPRPLPVVRELEKANVVYERTEAPFWDFDDQDSSWKWIKQEPPSTKPNSTKRKLQQKKIMKELKRGFSCLICKNIMVTPVTTPCGHSFCKECLEGLFVGQSLVRERNMNGRQLRPKKNIMKCPSCYTDIVEYLYLLQVDVVLQNSIESMKANELGEEK